MEKGTHASDGRGGPDTRPGARAIAAVAALLLAATMWPVAPALADEQQVASPAGLEERGVDEGALLAQDEKYITVTDDTHRMTTGTYSVRGSVVILPDDTGNGIQVEKGARVVIHLEKSSQLLVRGRSADDDPEGVGRAAILLPEGSTLIISGDGGILEARGGAGGTGGQGGDAASSYSDSSPRTGDGGQGGVGGGGAGAGVGTDGGKGGAGGAGGAGISSALMVNSNRYGNDGGQGSAGSPAKPAGTVLVRGWVSVDFHGGSAGAGGNAGRRGFYDQTRKLDLATAAGTSGGGGGGAGGSAAPGIGSGGTGGGGGGGGASGNLDGEPGGYFADLDDLWGYGGQGGTSVWGGGSGARGDFGASNDGDDTDASRKYAKAGGAGGGSSEPKTVLAYRYYDENDLVHTPTVKNRSGHGVWVGSTDLTDLDIFTKLGNGANMVSGGGTFEYDGNKHAVSVNGAAAQSDGALGAQADGDDEDYAESGKTQIDGVEVAYSIVYYDEAGERLGSAPVMPGRYAAVVTVTCEDPERPDYNDSLVEPITITKRQVAEPTPVKMTFECADWATGEGALQDAFPGIDYDVDGKPDFEFVADVTAPDGLGDLKSNTSLKSAREVGEYAACFRLTDPATCQWEGEAEDVDECWVHWSIALAEFDPNDPAITYWGSSYDKAGTTVAHTGDPQWVRPWFTPARNTDGRFPEWFTHWGAADRPTTDRASAAVVYVRGEGDSEGLVGYHTNADGSLEPVTALQVYAWMFGVDVSGRHVDVESGDKVWYKVDGDEVIVLSVERAAEVLAAQADAPEGATGSVVARDLAYADKLGVRDAGTYMAYAYFDEGVGFAPTALAETTVEVKAADVPAHASNTPAPTTTTRTTTTAPATGTASRTATAVPSTADASIPGALAAALLGAGALALARRRR